MAADWNALHRALWRAVKAHEVRVGETAEEYAQAIVEAVTAGGYRLTAEAEQILIDYLDAGDGLIRDGIERAVEPIVDATVAAPAMRSGAIARAVEDAYTRRWPDGLHLSTRVWRWQEETRAGVSQALANGVRVGQAAESVMMDMQRAIEAAQGGRFALAGVLPPDWVSDLKAAAHSYIKTPGAKMGWNAVVRDAQEHVAGLRDGGTRRQAEHALEQIRKAVEDGRDDLVDKTVKWWTYDRQQYALRRIVRTEMATAHHRAVIAAAQDDPDVTGFVWRLSASHPEPDICDYYADVDFGMGAGVWPKDRVPQGKAHPHCMCSLTPTTRKMRKDGKRGATDYPAFLGRLPEGQLKEMVPAWAREAHAEGTPWEALMRPDGLGFRAQGGSGAPAPMVAAMAAGAGEVILRDTQAPDFARAKAGGRHAGLYRRYQDSRIPEIEKSIRSLEKRVAEHEDKILHPERVLRPECTERERLHLIQRYWPEEIADFRSQIAVLRGIVEERTQ